MTVDRTLATLHGVVRNAATGEGLNFDQARVFRIGAAAQGQALRRRGGQARPSAFK